VRAKTHAIRRGAGRAICSGAMDMKENTMAEHNRYAQNRERVHRDARPSGPAEVEAGRRGNHWFAPRDYGAQAAAGRRAAVEREPWHGAPPRRESRDDPFVPQPYRYGMRAPAGVLHDCEQLIGGEAVEGWSGFRCGPKGYRRSDERIREDVCEALMSAVHLDASDVTVDVGEGVVTLQGIVPERRMKHAIEDIAAGCRGVSDVENRIRVVRGGADPLLAR
jgi:hypothetical protein